MQTPRKGEQKMRERESPLTLLTCSGLSNTGRLTTQVAIQLQRRYPDLFEEHITAKQLILDQEQILRGIENVVVVDGCSDGCAAKKLQDAGYEPYLHVIATDHGVVKKGMEEVQYLEIACVTSAVIELLRGYGRTRGCDPLENISDDTP